MARDDQGQEFSSDSSANKLAISAREDSRANVHGRGPSSTLHQRPASVDTVREWARRWYQVLKENEQELRGLLAEADEVGIDIKGVYADGLVTAVAFSHGDVYPCYLQNDGKSFSAQCGCMAGSQFCPHTLALLEDMLLQLEDRSSPLASRIRRGEFNTNKPNFKIFQVDEKAKIKQLLDGLVPASPPQLDDEDASALPPVETATPNRLAWNILIRNNRVEAVAVLQQAKKRGNGWTKGRRIPLENLSDYSDLCSATDRKVRDLVHYVSQSYRPTYYLDSMQAIGQLIGAANVLLNGEPVEVHLADATLVFREDAEGCWLSLEHSVSGHSQFVFAHDSFTHLRTDIHRIEVCFLQPQQVHCLREAIKLPKLPLEHKGELLDTAKRLQSVLTIHLPESEAGRIEADDCRPVLLLRSRRDGTLDYGFRVRNGLGNLHKPGRGQLLRHAERDGQPLQLKRSLAGETQLGHQLLQRFEIDAPDSEWNGTLHDFALALRLIERLQHAADEEELEILWDKSSEKPLRVLGAVTSQNVSVGIAKKRDWFQLSGSCDFGREAIDLQELLSSVQAAGESSLQGEYVRLGDKGWAKISDSLRQQFKQLADSVNQERGTFKFDASSAPAVRDLLSEQVQLKATRAWQQCLERLEQAEQLEPQLPQDLQAELRDYQCEGFRWLRRLAQWGVGGILADDMGLGKTLQTLAVILDRSSAGPTLVIAPTSVGFNWVRESERFAPRLDVHLYRETERAEFLQQVGAGSLVICSYGLALRDAAALAAVEWHTLVLDEAQAIKNSRSKTSAAIAQIPADWKVALTGTPVENHLGELWSLFHVVAPGVLGGWEQFRRRFASPIEKDNDVERRQALGQRLQPFLLRRTKKQVLKDLPPRTEMNLYVELSPAERELYNQVRLSALGEAEKLAQLPEIKDQRFRILALMTRLRQLACSPRLVHETWSERSSKLQQLCETLSELRDEGHRVLVFSQFVQHLTLIREMLEQEQIRYEYLDGSTPAQARQERVDAFQQGDASVFLISLKAGGTGLNLTAADYVIHMDPWWNPAVEDQATDRAHRMGQEKPVMVYRLVARDTIEEEILKLHEGKRELVAGIMEGSATAGKLSTEDLLNLLRS